MFLLLFFNDTVPFWVDIPLYFTKNIPICLYLSNLFKYYLYNWLSEWIRSINSLYLNLSWVIYSVNYFSRFWCRRNIIFCSFLGFSLLNAVFYKQCDKLCTYYLAAMRSIWSWLFSLTTRPICSFSAWSNMIGYSFCLSVVAGSHGFTDILASSLRSRGVASMGKIVGNRKPSNLSLVSRNIV